MRLLQSEAPGVAIVDITLQDGSAGSRLELVMQMKATRPDVNLIVLSMQEEGLFAGRSVRAGAAGFVSKAAPAATLLKAINSALSGKVDLSESERWRTVASRKGVRSPEDMLSERELDIFRRIGLGQSVDQIAKQLHLSPRTVGTYRDRMREKLGLETAAALLRHATLWVSAQSS